MLPGRSSASGHGPKSMPAAFARAAATAVPRSSAVAREPSESGAAVRALSSKDPAAE
ncbi:hypothetical protein SVIOM74S_04085 [Streptomyces violarus]